MFSEKKRKVSHSIQYPYAFIAGPDSRKDISYFAESKNIMNSYLQENH